MTNGLNDYANKQFSGITRDYYLQRYLAFSSVMADAIRAGSPQQPNATRFAQLLTPIALNFASGRTVYPADPVGDAIAVSRTMFGKYAASYVDASCGQ